MNDLFVAVLGDEDVALNKPDPEMLLAAIEKLALPKDEVVMVGDSLVDIQAAQNTGIRIFAVPSGTTRKEVLQEAKPTALLERLSDLLNHLP